MTDVQPEHAPVLEVTDARQARRGRHALVILIVSTFLVVLALFGAWAMRSDDLAEVEPNGTSQTTAAGAFSAPEPAARQTEDSAPRPPSAE